MPSRETLLALLERIADDSIPIAVAWHALVLGAVLVAFAARYRPSSRLFASACILPVASVALVAWFHGAVFNGAVFTALTAALAVAAANVPDRRAKPGRGRLQALGLLLLAYAWFYPHFLPQRSAWLYAIASPLGVVPCPTLALVAAITLLGDGLRSRLWCAIVASAALFYALVGVLYLRVFLDVGLLAAAVAVGALALRRSALAAR